MYSEITESLFKSIVTKETKCINAIQLDHAFKTMFFVHGVLLLKVENYLSFVTQYYIQDINAWTTKFYLNKEHEHDYSIWQIR